jgi:anion-transporting  ArsA/GET3 family ATPase
MSLATLNDILDVLKHRRAHCRDLLDLSRRQNRVIDASDYSSLLGILGQKQRILGRLDELNRRYPELSRQWTALRETGQPNLRSECQEIISETEAILAELVETEKVGAEQLCQRRDTTRRQLESIAEGVHVNDTYLDNVAPFNHRFLDLNR